MILALSFSFCSFYSLCPSQTWVTCSSQKVPFSLRSFLCIDSCLWVWRRLVLGPSCRYQNLWLSSPLYKMGVVFAYKPCMSFYKLNFLDIFFNFILNLFIFGWRLITVLCCFCHISYVISRLLVILNVNNCQGGVLIFWNFLEVFFFFF